MTFGPNQPGWGPPSFGDRRFYTADPSGEIVLAAEGELDEKNPDEHLPGSIPLMPGVELRIHPDYFRMIMHSPEITAAVTERCVDITSEANEQKVRPEAVYDYMVSNNTDNIRARGRVKPMNVDAMFDDAENSTLLKALATAGSDPLPPQYFGGDSESYTRYITEHEEFHSEENPVFGTADTPEGTVGGSYMGGEE
jgi:hypothetical protein